METIILAPEEYKKGAPAPSIQELPIKEETPETVMISPGGIPQEVPSTRLQKRREPEDTLETVMISPFQAKGKEEPPETIIVSPSKAPQGAGRTSAAFPPEDSRALDRKVSAPEAEKEESREEDFLSETVMLSPKEVRDKKEKHGTKR